MPSVLVIGSAVAQNTPFLPQQWLTVVIITLILIVLANRQKSSGCTELVMRHIWHVKPFCHRAGASSQQEGNDNGSTSNAISQLQELIQKRRWPPPVYEFTDEFGPLHARSHTCTIHLLEKSLQGEKLRTDTV